MFSLGNNKISSNSFFLFLIVYSDWAWLFLSRVEARTREQSIKETERLSSDESKGWSNLLGINQLLIRYSVCQTSWLPGLNFKALESKHVTNRKVLNCAQTKNSLNIVEFQWKSNVSMYWKTKKLLRYTNRPEPFGCTHKKWFSGLTSNLNKPGSE